MIKRKGVTLLELIVACGVLFVLLSTTSVMTGQILRQRRVLHHHVVATEVLANVMEQLDVMENRDLEALSEDAMELPSDLATDALPDARVRTTVQRLSEDGRSQLRVSTSIDWKSHIGEQRPTVTVVLWKPVLAGDQ